MLSSWIRTSLFPPYCNIIFPPTVLWWELLRNNSNFYLQPQPKTSLNWGYSALLRIETIHKFKLLLLSFSDKHLLQHILKIRWWKQQNLLLTNLDNLECSQIPRILFKVSRHFFFFLIYITLKKYWHLLSIWDWTQPSIRFGLSYFILHLIWPYEFLCASDYLYYFFLK